MITADEFDDFIAGEIVRKIAPLVIRTGAAFAREYKPLEYAIDGLLPKATLTTITGPGNIGKTAVGMLMAGCKANGSPFDRREVPPGHVLYASAENTTDFRHRYIGMRDNWLGGFNEDRFHVLTATEQGGLITSAEKIGLYATLLKISFDLVIVDTQAAWSPVVDEVNNSEQIAYARALRQLCFLPGSPSVVVLSHPTKSPTKASECRPRGGVAFENETDGNWSMWATNNDLIEVAPQRLRVPRWQPFSVRMREIETTSVVDIKGRPLRSVRAEIVSTEEAEAAAKVAKPVRKTKAELAHDVLTNTLIDHPERSPDKRSYPTDRPLTATKRFRDNLAVAGIIDLEGDERGQWRDIKDAMLRKGTLRIDGALCWSPV